MDLPLDYFTFAFEIECLQVKDPMHLETEYKNPEVILTIAASSQQQDYVRYLKCIGLLMITVFLVFFSGSESLLLSLSVVVFVIALIMLILNRPRVVMNSIKKFVHITGKRDGSENYHFPPNMVDKIRVRSRSVKSGKWNSPPRESGAPRGQKRHLDTYYYSQLFLKDPSKKARKKARIIETFELQDIVEAHYMAQLIASFTDSKAFDVKGKVLPSTNSHIPTKYLKEED